MERYVNEYPRDEFDDVPEDSSRRGVYRGKVVNPRASMKGLWAILAAGTLALLVGTVMFVVQPRTLAPDAGLNSHGNKSANEWAGNGQPSASYQPKDPSEVTVQVFNGGTTPAVANQVQQVLKQRGFQVKPVKPWDGHALSSSVAYYSHGFVGEAGALADDIGVPYIDSDNEAKTDVYVVLGPDYLGVDEARAAAASASASPSDAASSAPASTAPAQ